MNIWVIPRPRRGARRALALALMIGSLMAIVATPAHALPPGWGYELVSPADTAGESFPDAVGFPDGEHALITVGYPLLDDQVTGNFTTYLATRTGTGWHIKDLSDPSSPGDITSVVFAHNVDGSQLILQRCQQILSGCRNGSESWQQVRPDGSRTTVLRVPFATPKIDHFLSDGSGFFFENKDPEFQSFLPEDTHTMGAGAYEFRNGILHFIGVDENGVPFPCGATLGKGQNDGGFGTGFMQDGISEDGNTVVLESPDPFAGCPEPVDVYVRRAGHVLNVSAPTNGEPDLGANYVGSSSNGDSVYFTTTSRLVNGDQDDFRDLYSYDVPTQSVTRITPGAEVDPKAAVSPAGTYVYFGTTRAIAGQGADGQANLFVYHDGVIRLIRSTDQGSFFLGKAMAATEPSSPITPDGTRLLFTSEAPLTGQPTGGTVQLFQYDADTDHLACVSCPPDGHVPSHKVELGTIEVEERAQSDDGRAVAFQTAEQLLPQDSNSFRDVYLWQEGLLSLVSSGRASADSRFAGMAADGNSVFFKSRDALLPGRNFAGLKLYVVRLNPIPPPAAAPPGCDGDSCQGGPIPVPSFIAPASQALVGPRKAKLRKALKTCRAHHRKAQRKRCEANARKRLGKSGGSK